MREFYVSDDLRTVTMDSEIKQNLDCGDSYTGIISTILYHIYNSDPFCVINLEQDGKKEEFLHYVHFYVKYEAYVNVMLLNGMPTIEEIEEFKKTYKND